MLGSWGLAVLVNVMIQLCQPGNCQMLRCHSRIFFLGASTRGLKWSKIPFCLNRTSNKRHKKGNFLFKKINNKPPLPRFSLISSLFHDSGTKNTADSCRAVGEEHRRGGERAAGGAAATGTVNQSFGFREPWSPCWLSHYVTWTGPSECLFPNL